MDLGVQQQTKNITSSPQQAASAKGHGGARGGLAGKAARGSRSTTCRGVEPYRLGCIFHRRNPERYKNVRSCSGIGFKDIARHNEHLDDVHDFKCPRCATVLQTQEDWDQHGEIPGGCDYRSGRAVEHLTKEMSDAIKSLPRLAPGTAPGDKWREIYRLAFPNDIVVPPPYIPSTEQYRQVALDPPQGLKEALFSRVREIEPVVALDSASLKRLIVETSIELLPAFFDIVCRHGILPASSTRFSSRADSDPGPASGETGGYTGGLGPLSLDCTPIPGWQEPHMTLDEIDSLNFNSLSP